MCMLGIDIARQIVRNVEGVTKTKLTEEQKEALMYEIGVWSERYRQMQKPISDMSGGGATSKK